MTQGERGVLEETRASLLVSIAILETIDATLLLAMLQEALDVVEQLLSPTMEF